MNDSTVSQAAPISLPDKPLIVIKGGSVWKSVNLRELWEYRELFYFLTWRDVKIRYKQTALGVVWAVLQPVLTTLVFTLFFGRLANVPSDNVPYSLFAFAGLLPWTFFSNAVSMSGNSLVSNAHLITKVYFPRIVIPTTAVFAGLIDFGIGFLILFGFLFWFGFGLNLSFLLLPLLILLTILLAIAVGTGLSALTAKFRDFRFAMPFLIQIWMFASPVIYPASIVPEKWRGLFAINPLVGLIESYRAVLFNRNLPFEMLAISSVVTIVMFIVSLIIFRRMEREFADIV